MRRGNCSAATTLRKMKILSARLAQERDQRSVPSERSPGSGETGNEPARSEDETLSSGGIVGLCERTKKVNNCEDEERERGMNALAAARAPAIICPENIMKEPMKRRERRPIRSTAKRPLQKGEPSVRVAEDNSWRSRDLRESSSDVTGAV